MKIDLDFIQKIFKLEIKLTNEKDKNTLSKYEDYIPMYDIYSKRIYPINKSNLYSRLLVYHYRFINNEIYDWLKLLYEKYKTNKILEEKYSYNLAIINNYNLNILIDTSYKTLYQYSTDLGLKISICKRNSFNELINHLNPYYTKTELIKLGQNMGIINTNIKTHKLIDQALHYDICLKVSHNDVSFSEIKNHHEYIFKNNIISWICFYSFIGSALFNKYLRKLNIKSISDNFKNGLYNIVKIMENAPALENEYNIYRFIWDDSFMINIQPGDYLVDTGFLSTTRDPFYSPGLNLDFGLILLKILIPKNKKGLGLFIENYS